MSALNLQTPPASQSEERRAHEPSMEEILASIRRIIADDGVDVAPRRESAERRKDEDLRSNVRREAPEPSRPAAPVEAVDSHTSGVSPRIDAARSQSDLVESSAAAVGWPPLRAVADEADVEEASCVEEASYEEDAPYPAYEEEAEAESLEGTELSYQEPVESAAPLVSPDAAASIAAQFQTLAASMVINDSGLLHEYAREMLRPMLKAWLDDNLPVLVERLVRAEIERVARGGRR
jgi:cell pole-organizing protein PopZ